MTFYGIDYHIQNNMKQNKTNEVVKKLEMTIWNLYIVDMVGKYFSLPRNKEERVIVGTYKTIDKAKEGIIDYMIQLRTENKDGNSNFIIKKELVNVIVIEE